MGVAGPSDAFVPIMIFSTGASFLTVFSVFVFFAFGLAASSRTRFFPAAMIERYVRAQGKWST